MTRLHLRRALFLLLGGLLLLPAHAAAQEEVVYYHTDAIGSVRAITDHNGDTIARYDYLPFGELWPTTPPPPNERRQFAGKERDFETTGLDYFGARYHRPVSGRFTTIDPVMNVEAALVDPQRWNRYAYVHNRPLTMVDPDGREAGYAYMANGRMLSPYDVGFPRSRNPIRDTVVMAGTAAAGLFGGPAAIFAIRNLAIGAELGLASFMGSQALGRTREAIVARIEGGRVANDMIVTGRAGFKTGVDVIGSAGEYIGVGGAAKAKDLGDFGNKLKTLFEAAREAGVGAKYYFDRNTPAEAVALAQKWLGEKNVFFIEYR